MKWDKSIILCHEISLDFEKFCSVSLRFVKYYKVLAFTEKDQRILLLNSAKLSTKFLLHMSWLVEKGLFEHKWTLDFISFTFVCANWIKFRTTFVQTFLEFWPLIAIDFLNSNFWLWLNFIPFCLVHDWNLLLCTYIALT